MPHSQPHSFQSVNYMNAAAVRSAEVLEGSRSQSQKSGLSVSGSGGHVKAAHCLIERNVQDGLCVQNEATVIAEACRFRGNNGGGIG